jgi:nitrogen regulatory protein PII
VKKIEATIRPFLLAEVCAALASAGVRSHGVTVEAASDGGEGVGVTVILDQAAHVFEVGGVLRLELVVPDRQAARARDAIAAAACAGRGDGRVVITSIDEHVPDLSCVRGGRDRGVRAQRPRSATSLPESGAS